MTLKKILNYLVLSIFSLAFVILILFISDAVLGKIYQKKTETPLSDIFTLPPNMKVHYDTSEFSINVKTNSLGFRGNDYPQDKKEGTIRILTIGDSFTYGWGVNNEETYSAVLEKLLNERIKSRHFEVLNLGKPGNEPNSYLESLKKHLSLYSPDLTIIGILEGDDLGQMMIWPDANREVNETTAIKKQELVNLINLYYNDPLIKFKDNFKKLLSGFFPNLNSLFIKNKTANVRGAELSKIGTYVSILGNDQIKRLDAINGEILTKYLKGDINPILFNFAVARPDNFTRIFDTNDPEVIIAKIKLASISSEMKTIADREKSRVIFLDLPYGIFVSQNNALTQKKMGLSYIPDSWISNIPSEDINEAAKAGGNLFLSTIEAFRNNCHDDCFYPYDGHMTAKGHQLIAQSLFNYISILLRKEGKI